MEPFTVVCPTCQSRIRVRNIGLIGQLVNCPKCSSIVLIAEPDRTTETRNEAVPVDSKAITRDGIDLNEIQLAPDTLPEPDPDEYRLAPVDDLDLRASRGAAKIGLSGTATSGSEIEVGVAAPPVQWSPTGRASPSQEWTSEITNRKRQYLLVAAIGLASLLVTGGLFALFLRWANEAAQTIDERRLAASDSPKVLKTGEADQKSVDSNESRTLKNFAEDFATDHSTAESGAQPADSLADSTESPKTPSANSTIEQSPETKAATEDRDVVDMAETEAAVDPIAALPTRLRELAQLIGEPFEFSVPQTLAVPEKPPVTAEELGIRADTIDKSLPTIDIHAASNERTIRGLRIDAKPLAHAINYLSLASGLPIIADASSLNIANANRSSIVGLKLDEGSVHECLQQFAQQINLQLKAVNNQFYVFYAQSPDASLLPFLYNIGDLVTDDAGQQWMRATIAQFFPHVSEGITLEEATLNAREEKVDVASWFTLLRMLENWRSHLGLPSGLPQYRSENLRVPFVMPSSMQRLNEPLELVVAGPRQLASLLTKLCEQVELECWVDWPSLTKLGLQPSTSIAVVTFRRTLKSILQELAFEHNLVAVIIDERTLWITSPQSYRASPDIFVLPSENRDIDYWEQFIRPLTPVLVSGVSKTELTMTTDRKFVMFKCCRPTIEFN